MENSDEERKMISWVLINPCSIIRVQIQIKLAKPKEMALTVLVWQKEGLVLSEFDYDGARSPCRNLLSAGPYPWLAIYKREKILGSVP